MPKVKLRRYQRPGQKRPPNALSRHFFPVYWGKRLQLMSLCQGVHVLHPNKWSETFYRPLATPPPEFSKYSGARSTEDGLYFRRNLIFLDPLTYGLGLLTAKNKIWAAISTIEIKNNYAEHTFQVLVLPADPVYDDARNSDLPVSYKLKSPDPSDVLRVDGISAPLKVDGISSHYYLPDALFTELKPKPSKLEDKVIFGPNVDPNTVIGQFRHPPDPP